MSQKLRNIVCCLAVCLTALCTNTLSAQSERDIKNLKGQVKELRAAAKELMAADRVNDAEEYLAKAKQLAAKLEYWAKAREHKERGKNDSDKRAEILNDLEHGVRGLRSLGRKEEAQRLLQILRDYADKKRDGKRGHDREVEMAKKHLAIFRYAKTAFGEAEKEHELELVERIMHAREIAISGRRDAEAREIMERSPGRGDQIELLNWAAKILREYRANEKAAACHELAKHLSGIGKRQKQQKRKKPTERRRKERGERRRERQREEHEEEEEHEKDEGDNELEGLDRRVRQLQEQIEELRKELRRRNRKGM